MTGTAAPDLLNHSWYETEEAAALLGINPPTLRRWRTGPPFVQLTYRVAKYSVPDVETWLASRRVDPAQAAMAQIPLPVGIRLSADVEYQPDRPAPYRARVRWTDPITKERQSRSEAFATNDDAQDWIKRLQLSASRRVTPATAALSEYGEEV